MFKQVFESFCQMTALDLLQKIKYRAPKTLNF